MIIGNRHVTDAEIVKNGKRLQILAQKSIPTCCRDSKKLLDNQLFFLVSRFRNQTTVPYAVQQRIVTEVSSDIESITGTMGTIHDIQDILVTADVNSIFEKVFGKSKTNLSEQDLHLAIEAVLHRGAHS